MLWCRTTPVSSEGSAPESIRCAEEAILVRALEYEGFVEDLDWVYRLRDHEWGAKGLSHFYKPERPVTPSRIVMDHILDRLGIHGELRDSWRQSHSDDVIT